MATQTDGTDSMTTPQVTSEEIAKAREFLREVRAVCRNHKMQIAAGSIYLHALDPEYEELCVSKIVLCGADDIDLNEG